jgi:hypothetical protein
MSLDEGGWGKANPILLRFAAIQARAVSPSRRANLCFANKRAKRVGEQSEALRTRLNNPIRPHPTIHEIFEFSRKENTIS